MTALRSLVAGLAVVACLHLASAGALADEAAPGPAGSNPDAWAHASGEVEDLADFRTETEFAKPDEDSARSRRLSVLLDDAVDRISDGDAKEARKIMGEVAERRKQIRDEIADARMEQASAPKEKGVMDMVLGLAGMSPEEKIKSLEAEKIGLDQREKDARDALVRSLEAAGVHLTQGQVDGLLMLATGDRLVDMMSAFANLKSIEEELRRVVEDSGETSTSARRYYGLHATLAETALYMQQQFITEIDERYLPELARIETEAKRLKDEANGLLAGGGNDHEVLKANQAAQDLTIKTAGLYRKELERQRSAMAAAAARTKRDVQVAINTWKTVKVSTDLVAMIRSADGDFKGLLALQLPDLKPFGGAELRSEFERITVRLNAAPGS